MNGAIHQDRAGGQFCYQICDRQRAARAPDDCKFHGQIAMQGAEMIANQSVEKGFRADRKNLLL
ncbi:hypothetical protein D2K34_22830 [Salmonella enterica subsp. enterica serovar Ohio]|nr:hypothetical protein [Salmonella enterica subsp. enterica serovar Ohio]